MLLSAAAVGGPFAEGVLQKAGEKFGEKSHAVERAVHYLLRHEEDILLSLEGLPPDVPAAAREFFRRLRADYPPPSGAGKGP